MRQKVPHFEGALKEAASVIFLASGVGFTVLTKLRQKAGGSFCACRASDCSSAAHSLQ